MTIMLQFISGIAAKYFDLHLSQLIHNPTHITGNILDLVLTNDCTLISDVKVDCDRKLFLSSNHFPIYFSIISKNVKHVSLTKFINSSSKKGNLNGLCDFLLDCNFDFCYTSTNINLIWSELKQIITSAFADFTPIWRNGPHKAPKWFNSNVHHNLNCIHSLRRNSKFSINKIRTLRTSFTINHVLSQTNNCDRGCENQPYGTIFEKCVVNTCWKSSQRVQSVLHSNVWLLSYRRFSLNQRAKSI